jgi:hypothetical protein
MRGVYILTFLLIGCAGNTSPDSVYRQLDVHPPTPQSFIHCHGYGCRLIQNTSLEDSEIKQLKSIFADNSSTSQERNHIANAIAYLEQSVGKRMGTNTDVKGTYIRLGNDQLDCIDESTNTTTYLSLLDQLGLLKFHQVNALTSRAPIISGRLGPHRTAVITETETGIKFAVDSWFHDNGVKPEIVELSIWRWGWHPDEKLTD